MKSKFKKTEIGVIPEEWEVKFIPEIAENFDSLRKPLSSAERKKMQGKYPYYGAASIIDYVNDFIYDGCFLLIAEDGTVTSDGSKPMVQIAQGRFWVSNHSHVLRCKKREDTLYLFYQLKNINIIPFITGAVQPKLSQRNLNQIQILWPKNEKERKQITKILSDLDAKIELNQQMNRTLEAIGQAIFKHWFVDFEFPNEKGKPYKSSGGEMVYNEELGKEIPKGWRVGKIGEIGRIQPGFAFKSSDFVKEGVGLIKIKNIDKSGVVNLDFEDFISNEVFAKTNKKFYLYSGDIIIAMTGAEIGKVGILPKIENPLLLNQRVGKVVSDYKYFIYLFLKSDYCQSLIKGISSASSAQGNISNSDIENITFVIPDKKIMDKFNKISTIIHTRLFENLEQNIILSAVRDSLLPKLMSGKIRVPEEVGK